MIIKEDTLICRLTEAQQDEIFMDLLSAIYGIKDMSVKAKRNLYNHLISGSLKEIKKYIDISKYIGKDC